MEGGGEPDQQLVDTCLMSPLLRGSYAHLSKSISVTVCVQEKETQPEVGVFQGQSPQRGGSESQ